MKECDRQTDRGTSGHPDRQTESIIDTKTPRLGAEINKLDFVVQRQFNKQNGKIVCSLKFMFSWFLKFGVLPAKFT